MTSAETMRSPAFDSPEPLPGLANADLFRLASLDLTACGPMAVALSAQPYMGLGALRHPAIASTSPDPRAGAPAAAASAALVVGPAHWALYGMSREDGLTISEALMPSFAAASFAAATLNAAQSSIRHTQLRNEFRMAVALSCYTPLWRAIAQGGEQSQYSGALPFPSARDDGRELTPSPGTLYLGPQATGRSLPFQALTDTADLWHDLQADITSALAAQVGPAEAGAVVSCYAAMSSAPFAVSNRFDYLARLVLGVYNFYGAQHDERNPYLVESGLATARGLKPPRAQARADDAMMFLERLRETHPDLLDALPGNLLPPAGHSQNAPLRMPNPYCVLPPALADWMVGAAVPMATNPMVMALYRHPALSQDYGQRNGASMPDIAPSLQEGLCHTGWLDEGSALAGLHAAERGLTSQALTLDRTPNNAQVCDELLPADQLLACCTIAAHADDACLLEAATIMNPASLITAAKLVGVEESLIRRYAVVQSLAIGCEVSPQEREACLTPLDVLALHAREPEFDTRPAAIEYAAVITHELVATMARQHATNILERHPVLMDPYVLMPVVRDQYNVLPSDGRGNPGLTLTSNLAGVLPNLLAADIPLPTGAAAPAFANHPSVKACFADRVAQATPAVFKASLRRGEGLLEGLPFAVTSKCEAPDSQLGAAIKWFSTRYEHSSPDFLASVFELNTHTHAFIAYQDEFKQYLSSLDPATGQGAPAPTSSPFQLVPLSAMVAPTNLAPQELLTSVELWGSGDAAKGRKGRDELSGDIASLGATVSAAPPVIANLLRGFFLNASPSSRAALSALSESCTTDPTTFERYACTTETQVTAPPQSDLIELASRLARDKGYGLSHIVDPSKPQVSELMATAADAGRCASMLRLTRAVRANVGGGCVTAPFATVMLPIRSLSLIDPSILQSEISLGHLLGLSRTRVGAARALFASHAFFNPFVYRHEIDGLYTHATEGPALVRAFNQAAVSGLTRAPQSGGMPAGLEGGQPVRGPVNSTEPDFYLHALPGVDNLDGQWGRAIQAIAANHVAGVADMRSLATPWGLGCSVAAANVLARHGLGVLALGVYDPNGTHTASRTMMRAIGAGEDGMRFGRPETYDTFLYAPWVAGGQDTNQMIIRSLVVAIDQELAARHDLATLCGAPGRDALEMFDARALAWRPRLGDGAGGAALLVDPQGPGNAGHANQHERWVAFRVGDCTDPVLGQIPSQLQALAMHRQIRDKLSNAAPQPTRQPSRRRL